MSGLVIAIDGPSASGKSTVAAAVAAALGLERLDTGAMYRALTLASLRDRVSPDDGLRLADLARRSRLEPGPPVLLDGKDVTTRIREPDVTRIVSSVSAHAAVREEMVRRQRTWVRARGGGVVEGRDIGSVVFPDADLKIYLTAHEGERAKRRLDGSPGTDVEEVSAELRRRDHLDASRASSPLLVAEDAAVIDTTDRSVDDVVSDVVSRL